MRDPHFKVPCIYVYDQYPGGHRALGGIPEGPPARSPGRAGSGGAVPLRKRLPVLHRGARGAERREAGGSEEAAPRGVRASSCPAGINAKAAVCAFLRQPWTDAVERSKCSHCARSCTGTGAAPADGPPAGFPVSPAGRGRGSFSTADASIFPGLAWRRGPRHSPGAVSPTSWCSTTRKRPGLSGGAGSVDLPVRRGVVPRARTWWWSSSSSRISPGEPEFLAAVADLLKPYRAFVSYNGKTFDSHLLQTRFLDEPDRVGAGPPGGPAAPRAKALEDGDRRLQPEVHRDPASSASPGSWTWRGRTSP